MMKSLLDRVSVDRYLARPFASLGAHVSCNPKRPANLRLQSLCAADLTTNL
jgi:hypothetical protein